MSTYDDIGGLGDFIVDSSVLDDPKMIALYQKHAVIDYYVNGIYKTSLAPPCEIKWYIKVLDFTTGRPYREDSDIDETITTTAITIICNWLEFPKTTKVVSI